MGGSILDTTLFNATTNTGGDDPAGLGTNYASSPPLFGTDVIQDAFGNNDGPVEPTTFLFADAGTPDNGNGVFEPSVETVDWISWQTTQNVVLDGYRVGLGSEGPGQGYNRGTELFTFQVNGEGDDFFDDNAVHGGGVDRYFAVPQVGNSFAVNLTRTTSGGPRIDEIDAIVPEGLQAHHYLDTVFFNAATNGPEDEAPGYGVNFAASSSIPGDTIEDAFGNQNGGVESHSFLFADNGTPDNGNNTFDGGTETIDWLTWQTTKPVELHGFRIEVAPDIISGDPIEARGTELLRFFVGGTLVDTIDFNHSVAVVDRIFAGGPVTGDDFRIELTRSTDEGSRIMEIDAILPEPTTVALMGLAGVALLRRRRP